MKYYKMSTFITIDGIVQARMDGSHVKGRESFFDDNCGPDEFFDKMYEFDYLVPFEDEDLYGKKTTEFINDYHGWRGEEPMGGWLQVVSKRFKEILESFEIGDHQFYSASVLFKEKKHPYFVLQIFRNYYKKFIDFERTIFNNMNFSRKLKNQELKTNSFSSIEDAKAFAKENWGSIINWNYERIVMKPEFRNVDLITFYKFGDLVSERLKNAIEKEGLTGIQFEELPIPIEFSDEIEN